MRLYVETMDAVLVDVASDGRVKFDAAPDTEAGWVKPTVQERRAIIHAAQGELESLKELLDMLEQGTP